MQHKTWINEGCHVVSEALLHRIMYLAAARITRRESPGRAWASPERRRTRRPAYKGFRRLRGALALALMEALLSASHGYKLAYPPPGVGWSIWRWAQSLALAFNGPESVHRLLCRYSWLRPYIIKWFAPPVFRNMNPMGERPVLVAQCPLQKSIGHIPSYGCLGEL